MIAEYAQKTAVRAPAHVSRPSDAAERQAARAAREIVALPTPRAMPAPHSMSAMRPASAPRAGQPLPPSLRRFMEPRFEADFADVRVHTDERAAVMSRELNAVAFTQGRDIFFAEGAFQPDRREGRELIAHELTHTLQRSATGAARALGPLEAVPPEQIQRATAQYEIAGIRLFRTRSGDTVQLPPDISFAEAERLEAEGLAAERRLASKPAPAALPTIRRPAPTPPATQKKPPTKRRVRKQPRNPPAPAAAALGATLMEATGNSAVARHLAREGLPVLLRGVSNLQRLKRNQQTHDDAAQKRAQSEQAVVIPPSDLQSRSNESQVGQVAERPQVQVDPEVGKGRLQASLRENLPPSLEALDNFKRERRGQRMSAEVALSIHADKNAVVGNFGDLRQTPPAAPNDHVTQELPPEEVAPATPAANLGRGLVATLPKEHTDLSRFTQQADQRLKEEGVTQEQLDMVDSGDLAQARRDKQGLEQAAAEQPLAMQTFAREQSAEVEQTLGVSAARERGAMRTQRRSGLGRTAKRQRDAKAALEKKRDDVAVEINRRYSAAQSSVQQKLANLETSSIKRFDEGNRAAAQRFEDDVKRDLEAYKSDRYSGFFGRLRRLRDWLLGMDKLPRVKAIFDSNRAAFVRTIDALVETISADNKRVVEQCRTELKDARASIANYVAGLEPGLQDVGAKAAGEMGERLDALDRSIDQREQALRQQLQEKQQEAIKAIDQKIESMKQALSGALAKLGRLLLWAAKKFFTWALSKFGLALSDIESVISKGVTVLKAIFTGPIKFVKNLIKAAKDGFANFRDNFLTHLKNALFEWLTGSLTGVRLPEVWNARGILNLALQILDLGPDALKRRLLARLGGDNGVIARLERALPLVQKIFVEGPAAAWEEIKSEAVELEGKLVAELRNFVFIEIAKQAATKIIALFIPGAGIVLAIKAIYDTIVFFIQKARDIARMVGSFLGSLAEIAAGNTPAAAKALEDGLARALKLVIVFLARFLKLGGIPAKIKVVTEKLREKVDKVINRVIDWLVAQAKRLGLAVKSGAKKVVQALTRWWAARKEFKAADGQTHTLFFAGEERDAVLTVQTKPIKFVDFVNNAGPFQDTRRKEALRKAREIAQKLDVVRSTVPTGHDEAALEKARASKVTKVNKLLEQLAPQTSLLFGGASLPPSVAAVYAGQDAAKFGRGMKVKPLTKLLLKGKKPTSEPNPDYTSLDARRVAPGGSNLYIKGHLLNMELGGPGEWKNLVPLTIHGNARHERRAESVVKRTVDLAAIVEYHVEPVCEKRTDRRDLLERIEKSRDPESAKREKRGIVIAEDHVPKYLAVQAYILHGDLSQQGTVLNEKIENPLSRKYEDYFLATTPRPVPVDLSSDNDKVIETVHGIGPVLAKRIVKLRPASGRWSTYEQLAEAVGGIKAATLKEMEEAKHIRLFSR